jgi:hypothetical protein
MDYCGRSLELQVLDGWAVYRCKSSKHNVSRSVPLYSRSGLGGGGRSAPVSQRRRSPWHWHPLCDVLCGPGPSAGNQPPDALLRALMHMVTTHPLHTASCQQTHAQRDPQPPPLHTRTHTLPAPPHSNTHLHTLPAVHLLPSGAGGAGGAAHRGGGAPESGAAGGVLPGSCWSRTRNWARRQR